MVAKRRKRPGNKGDFSAALFGRIRPNFFSITYPCRSASLSGEPDTLAPTRPSSTELARRWHELRIDAEIVLLRNLGAQRANSRGHDGPELYESARLLNSLLAD